MAAFAACTEDYKDWANPQVNGPEDPQTIEVTVQSVNPIDYATLETDSVQVFSPIVTATTPCVTEYKVVFSKPEYLDGEEYKTAELTADQDGRVSASALKGVVETLYGKKPLQRNLQMDITGYTAVGGMSVVHKATSAVSVTLVAPFIDAGYYLTGDFAGWNKEGALAFTHIGSGDVYDNPEFQITFTTTADNQYWKIISKTNYDNDFWAGGETGVVGTVTDGDTSFEGTLVTDNPGAGKIEQAGMYRMTINMMDYTYKLEKLNFAQFVYFIGATDGWANPDQKLESPAFDGIYTGYVYCADPNGWGVEFKFQKRYGDWADDSQLNSNNLTEITGGFAKGGDNIVAADGVGVYYVTLDLTANTLHAVKINNMNLVGDFNGWNAADDNQQMTWDADNFCYVITGAGVTANGWKFTTNNSWDINLGGDTLDNLVGNGANITATGTTIKLYPTRKTSDKIYCTVE